MATTTFSYDSMEWIDECSDAALEIYPNLYCICIQPKIVEDGDSIFELP